MEEKRGCALWKSGILVRCKADSILYSKQKTVSCLGPLNTSLLCRLLMTRTFAIVCLHILVSSLIPVSFCMACHPLYSTTTSIFLDLQASLLGAGYLPTFKMAA